MFIKCSERLQEKAEKRRMMIEALKQAMDDNALSGVVKMSVDVVSMIVGMLEEEEDFRNGGTKMVEWTLPAEDEKEAEAEAEETGEELEEVAPPGGGVLPAGEFLLKLLSGFLLGTLAGAGFAALFLR